MDAFIPIALCGPLQVTDLNLGDAPFAQDVRAFCDAFARHLAERYLEGGITWPDADTVANNFFELMIQHCGDRVPDYAWDVYLAFDVGECTPPGGDAITRPLIEALHQKSALR